MTLQELRDFVDSLDNLQIGSGFFVKAQRDRNDVVGITGHFSDGLVSFKTKMIVFNLNEDSMTVAERCDRIRSLLRQEFLACWAAKYDKAVNPSTFNEDGLSVIMEEDIPLEGVIRI